jgi:hypothetical protein
LLAEQNEIAATLLSFNPHGGIAQLGERLHGMQEVIGSIPFTSTIKRAEEFEDTSFFRSWLNIFLFDYCPSA